MGNPQPPQENWQGLNLKGGKNEVHGNTFNFEQQGIIANDQAKIEIGVVNQINQPAPSPQPTGDEPPNNLQDRGVARDRFFGRDDVLEELHQKLQTGDHRVAIASVAGMGGVGKSELAVQYAREQLHKTYRGGVVWLAGERAGIELLGFAKSRFFPTVNLADIGDLPEQLDHCFAHWPAKEVPPESVLLIFDDVTDYRAQVAAILPSDSRFRVLITTRAQFQGVERLDLDVLTDEAALQLLESIVGDERIAAERETAAALCKWLGFLPLGIELVGYYLKRKGDLSLATMQERLEKQRLQARAIAPKDRDFPEGMAARCGVAAAFELSWQALDPEAQRLAVLLGCFGPAPVLWEWVRGCLADDDEEDLEDACGHLVKLSLVKAEDGQCALHPLIREFFAAKGATWPEGEALEQAFLGQMVSIAETVPQTVTLADLARTRPAWPHLETAATASENIADATDSTWPFIALGRLAEGQGLWSEAEQHYGDCLTTAERRFDPDHPATATSLNSLAGVYYAQGRYGEAEPLFRRSLSIREKVLGVDCMEFAESLNDLAECYKSQERYKEAETLLRQSLKIHEKKRGTHSQATALSLNNLAGLYYRQECYAEAKPLFLKSLEISERELGADHPDTAQSLHNLALLYYKQEQYEESEMLYRQSLKIREQRLGNDNPKTANTLNGLAALYRDQERYAEAEPLYLRCLEIALEKLGEDHPDTQAFQKGFRRLVQTVIAADRAADLSDHPHTQAILQELTPPPKTS